jgi:hypothetical protein
VVALFAALALLAPVHFAPAPGWHTGHGAAGACPGVPAERCTQVGAWASTIRWRDCADCLPPHRTLAALPPDGVVLYVELAIEHPPVAKHTIVWPPRIALRQVVGPVKGAPLQIGAYQTFARVGGLEVYVVAFFGRLRPTPAQLAAANAELRRAKLP